MHPGGIDTGLSQPFQQAHPWLAMLLGPVRIFLTSVQTGALMQLFAATSPNAKSGQYYVPVAKESLGSRYSQDWTEAELKGWGIMRLCRFLKCDWMCEMGVFFLVVLVGYWILDFCLGSVLRRDDNPGARS